CARGGVAGPFGGLDSW
nr:immunoglobulin heavy chain junction region [Macaca mulatta]MOY21385.1 immunoglobulin heavy chain junction region [Macaca mulatta]MOY21622.1 immunoglobulin heavy chain junction region [Macaca mulatta]MOY22454.1 immunoglobulin heavy chain junction region [Macaca mulatta]MOY22513.1 immunoglobulin heavy chain junction region [Macaca mulatta]